MSPGPPSAQLVAQEKQYMLANLNGALIYRFMLGIYTGLFALTLYLYFSKKNQTTTQIIIVIGSLAVLYIVTSLSNVLAWLYSNHNFVLYNMNRTQMFLYSVAGDLGWEDSDAAFIPLAIVDGAVFLCADGLLVWRCYHVCSHSLRSFLLPIMLLIAEACLVISWMIYEIFLHLKPQNMNTHTESIYNRLLSSTYISSALTSVVATSIICFKIYTHIVPGLSSRRHYRTIIDIIIQSSALYSTTVVLQAILGFVVNVDLTHTFNIAVGQIYVQALYDVIKGLAPTLMAARLCMASAQQDTEVFSTSATQRTLETCATQLTPGSPADVRGDDVEMQSKVPAPVGLFHSEFSFASRIHASARVLNVYLYPTSVHYMATRTMSTSLPAPVASSSSIPATPPLPFIQVLKNMATSAHGMNNSWGRPSLPPTFFEEKPSLTFQQIDLRQTGPESVGSEIHIFGVTKAGHSILARITGFEHYFYYPAPAAFAAADEEPFCKWLNDQLSPGSSIARVLTSGQGLYKDLFTSVGDTFEADVPYFMRFMVDNQVNAMTWLRIEPGNYEIIPAEEKVSHCQVEIKVNQEALLICETVNDRLKFPPLRILSFDIETLVPSDGSFPSGLRDSVIQIGNMVSIYGQETPIIRNIFVLDTCSPIEGAQVLSFDQEKDMLSAWQQFFLEVDPDVVIGYNVTQFDIPYLLTRANTLGLSQFPYLGRIKCKSLQMFHEWALTPYLFLSSPPMSTFRGRSTFSSCPGYDGRLMLDLFPHIREHYPSLSGPGAYKLNGVSAHFLGEKKEDMHYSNIPIFQHAGPGGRRTLAVYCLKDVYLPLLLFTKLKCFEIEVKEAKEAHVPYNVMRVARPLKTLSKRCLDAFEREYVIRDMAAMRTTQNVVIAPTTT
ncbi:hypothetical protein D9613_005965 [Agrocybe pediades]|uniref:DNA polymerase delta catalytic subunit n=1 Tax=Agrocybe pediades TaxID=84607 RepID=A0A8H4QUJ3_9AGAR|nr:hypothetical protein D9613_005965 [Agrocybe pediades]